MTEMSPRAQRVADQIQRELAVLIQLEVNDPRVGMVSVTGVDVSNDLASARVYVTILNDGQRLTGDQCVEADQDQLQQTGNVDSLLALNKAAGFLRSLLARRLRLRAVPRLRFYYDSSIERGHRLSGLIDDALAADRQFHAG